MIVLDENLHDHRLIRAVSGWYPGQVVSITTLRPRSVIRDDAVPTLLLQAVQPTFVTINAADFWRRIPPHNTYCIAVVALPKERVREIPGYSATSFASPSSRPGPRGWERTFALRPGALSITTPAATYD
jgi:hypothetical protein